MLEMYTSESAPDGGIGSVTANAPNASILDQSAPQSVKASRASGSRL